MRNIVGIGSCLSQRVANCLVAAGGATILSMVRHNRSDQILRALRGSAPASHESLRAIIAAYAGEMTDGFGNDTFAFGQSAEGMGRSTDPTHEPFLNVMDRDDVNLVLIDNFMDLRSFLWSADDGTEIFARIPDEAGLTKGARLPPETSASNFAEIARLVQAKWDRASVVFLHFPCNNYPLESNRPQWAKRFYRAYRAPEGTFARGPVAVPPESLLNGQPHHFVRGIYREIAEQVETMMALQERAPEEDRDRPVLR